MTDAIHALRVGEARAVLESARSISIVAEMAVRQSVSADSVFWSAFRQTGPSEAVKAAIAWGRVGVLESWVPLALGWAFWQWPAVAWQAGGWVVFHWFDFL